MKRFVTRNDLRQWIDEHFGLDGSPAIVELVTDYINADGGRPLYGADWAPYLDALPDLGQLLDEVTP